MSGGACADSRDECSAMTLTSVLCHVTQSIHGVVRGISEHWQHAVTSGASGRVAFVPSPEWGQYSDDTQMTRELASTIATRAMFRPECFAQRMLALFRRHALYGAGSTTSAALRLFEAGEHWSLISGANGRPSNGSAMRTGGVGSSLRFCCSRYAVDVTSVPCVCQL